MGWQEDFRDFDLGRLTVVGWLVSLLSVGAAIGLAYGFNEYWNAWFPPPPGADPRSTKLAGVVGFACASVFFLSMKWLLHRVGWQMMRPKSEPDQTPEETDHWRR